ncbi:MAG TPA: HemK family protein methyltransferase [Hyphomicrobium sp.]|nr:HemK family protein methyltransferase [Hyphomicrobium sp.]
MQFGLQAGPEAKEPVTFLGIDFEVAGAVLRPREETELLGRAAQEILTDVAGAPLCIDMCCGSGNLAIALAKHRNDARVWASDLTDGAVATARRNVDRHELASRVAILQGDLFAPMVESGLVGMVDLIVANPPYISTSRLLEGDRAHLLEHEPREAFDGGPYGIALHMRLINEAPAFLKSGGWLGFEFGLGQDRQVAALLKRARTMGEPVWHTDEAGNRRAVFIPKL